VTPTDSQSPTSQPTVSAAPSVSHAPSQGPSTSSSPSTSSAPSDSGAPSQGPSTSLSPSTSSPSTSSAPSDSGAPSQGPSSSLNTATTFSPSVGGEESVVQTLNVEPTRRFSVSSSSEWIPVCLALSGLFSAVAFLLGRRIGNNDASQKQVSYHKLEFELLYLQERLEWATEEGDSKESRRLEKLLTTKKTNLESRKDAMDMLKKAEVTWDAKQMKAKIKQMEEKQSDLTEKSKAREDVVRSLHEDNTLKQLKIEMLQEIVRTISGATSDDNNNVSKATLLPPSNAPADLSYAKNMSIVINEQNVAYTGPLRAGVPNGVGTVRFPDKSTYIGSIVDGKMHGNGALFMRQGMAKRGRFKDNEFVASEDHDGEDTVSLQSSFSSSQGSQSGLTTRRLAGVPTQGTKRAPERTGGSQSGLTTRRLAGVPTQGAKRAPERMEGSQSGPTRSRLEGVPTPGGAKKGEERINGKT
jgi:hypothetical protein